MNDKKICPIRDGSCPRDCGMDIHLRDSTRLNVILPEDPADANRCDGCE